MSATLNMLENIRQLQ